MKKLLLSTLAVFATSGVAFAQETTSSPFGSNAYVGVSSSLEGEADWTVGSEFGAFGVDVYGEFTYQDRAAGDDYSTGLGTKTDLGIAELSNSINYAWGASDGSTIIGRGDGNTWGTVTANPEVTITPGIVGGEFVYLGSTVGLIDDGSIDIGWNGAEYGVGYEHDLNESASVSISYGWSLDVVDDGDPATVNDWVSTNNGIKLGVGFKF